MPIYCNLLNVKKSVQLGILYLLYNDLVILRNFQFYKTEQHGVTLSTSISENKNGF